VEAHQRELVGRDRLSRKYNSFDTY